MWFQLVQVIVDKIIVDHIIILLYMKQLSKTYNNKWRIERGAQWAPPLNFDRPFLIYIL